MGEMSQALRKAASKVVKLAEDEGMVVVGFAIPKNLDNEGFGWSLFCSCDEVQANDLIITIADILREPVNQQVN